MNKNELKIKEQEALSSKKGKIKQFRERLSKLWQKTQPSSRAKKAGALVMVLSTASFAVLIGIGIRPGLPGILDILAGILLALIFSIIFGLLAGLFLKVITLLPRFFSWTMLMSTGALIIVLGYFSFPFSLALLIGLGLGIVQSFLGGSAAILFKKGFGNLSFLKKTRVVFILLLALAVNIFIVTFLMKTGSSKHLIEKNREFAEPMPERFLDLPDPSLQGPYKVLKLTYGSGQDRRRAEFGKDASLRTETVDAKPFVKENSGWKMKMRQWYWGFDFKKFPVNGRVWYPDGDGPFPLVLIVHGNHKMEEYSDPGYEYLGKLLASRGFIFVSVDENFFNGSWISNLKKENDGRGWMLLQHLKVWRSWSNAPNNPFYGKVDMSSVALIGHSRGGEAASIAGAFNRLSFYPDDATVAFDFGFNIKSIVSIAPSDGQYSPAGKPTLLENVNFLALQGAHDADVSVFVGDRQYKRVKFTDGKYWFKASLYAYRANHGQFNTVWGDSDWGWPEKLLLNKKPLLKGEDQRKISSAYISAFLEVTLHGNSAYIPFFRDWRLGAKWLPEDFFITRFADSTLKVVSDFEEDVDVSTASLKEAKIKGENLALWREQDIPLRNKGTKQNQAVYVGWRKAADESNAEKIAGYSIELPKNFGAEWALNENWILTFSLADANEKPPKPEEEKEKAGEETKKKEQAEEVEKKAKEEKKPMDLSLELVTAPGKSAKFPLSQFRKIPPALKSRFTKFGREKSFYGKDWETTLQTFEIPLSVVAQNFPGFTPARLRAIRFIFDRTAEGVIVLDDIGFAQSR